MSGWIGVDFDGTLAKSGTKVFDGPLGDPIWPMVQRVQGWVWLGIEVRIFTARVSPLNKDGSVTPPEEIEAISNRIANWTEKYVGCRLKSTCQKDHNVIALYDDRGVHVIRDTGICEGDWYGE